MNSSKQIEVNSVVVLCDDLYRFFFILRFNVYNSISIISWRDIESKMREREAKPKQRAYDLILIRNNAAYTIQSNETIIDDDCMHRRE